MNNRGIVQRVSVDKTSITIRLPRGGTLTCRNEGFEVGEEVCFVLDPSCRHVTKVLPREIAEIRNMIAADPILQHAIMEPPNEYLGDILEHLTKEDYHGDNATDDIDYRQIVEGEVDFGRGTSGEFVEGGDNYPYIPDRDDDDLRA